MATKPEDMQCYDPKHLKKIEQNIDEQLSYEVIDKNGFVSVELVGDPNKYMEKMIIKTYKDAGWDHIEISRNINDWGEVEHEGITITKPTRYYVNLYSKKHDYSNINEQL